MPWDPNRYLQFQEERFQPFGDLLGLIDRRDGLSVIDLGCGTGELTVRLADALPHSDVLGIDTSREMLQRTTQHARPGVRFEEASLEDVTGQWDLVFSHAVIQWVHDHRALIPQLWSLVRPGGQIAIQIPANFSHPSQRFIRAIAREEPFRAALDGWILESPVLDVSDYADLLYGLGGHNMTVLDKVYPHVLENADAMADWTSGTVLIPYFERLPDDLFAQFMDTYRARLRRRYPGSPVFFGFKRILFAARKA